MELPEDYNLKDEKNNAMYKTFTDDQTFHESTIFFDGFVVVFYIIILWNLYFLRVTENISTLYVCVLNFNSKLSKI